MTQPLLPYIDEESGKNTNQSVMNAITIDCAVFSFTKGKLEVLLVQHASGISKGKWGLPGGWIRREEHINQAAHRLLTDITGIDNIYLEQVKAFGRPDRFPLDRVITIGYFALIKREDYQLNPGFTASDAKWYRLDNVPDLIYDHNEILDSSLKKLQNRARQMPIGFNLLPEKFTLLQLMKLYEEIMDTTLDKSNFRRKILQMKLLVGLDEKEKNVSHRAAKLYKLDEGAYKLRMEEGFVFGF